MSEALDSVRNVAWLGSEKALIELDRELVRRGGLRMFVELAWHIIEPAVPFNPNWHIDEMCAELEDIVTGANRRLALAVPPRHGKSSILAVFFPAYVWIKNPARRMIFITYDFSLSLRDSNRTRDLINSEWFQKRWGNLFKLRTDNSIILETNRTGIRQCASVGGRIMGKGADIIVLDDPHDVKDVESEKKRNAVLSYWRERVQSRLNDAKTGAFVVCHQRVGEADLIGDILKRQRGQYRYLCLPARYDPEHPYVWERDPRTEAGELLWPSHIGDPELDTFLNNMGDYAFAAQYQQHPRPREGGLFKSHWFPKIRREELPLDIQWCRGWDFAATIKSQVKADPDYTATVLLGHSATTKKYYIGHAARWRIDYTEVDQKMKFYAEEDSKAFPGRYRIRYPQDPAAAGKSRAQQQGMMLSGHPFVCEPVSGDKAVNAAPFAGQAGLGNVVMVEDMSWNDDYVAELTSFPTGSHDDWVDASSSAFRGFLVTTTGVLDYYTQQLKQKQEAEQEQQSGFHAVHGETTNLASAFSPGGEKP